MVWNVSRVGDSCSILHVWLDEVDLIDLLEGLLRGLTEVIGTTDEDHRPAIGPSISNSADGVGVARSRDAKAYSWDASKVASVSGTIAGLLFVSATIIVDAIALDGKSKLDDWYTWIERCLPTIP